jgi:hypothetical protein
MYRSMAGREKMPFRKVREIVDDVDWFQEQDELDADVLKNFQFRLVRVRVTH